eukprot:31330-Pelagococcus_subviridis.AAC.5
MGTSVTRTRLHPLVSAVAAHVERGATVRGAKRQKRAVGRMRGVHRPSHDELRRSQRASGARRVEERVALDVGDARHDAAVEDDFQLRDVVSPRGRERLGSLRATRCELGGGRRGGVSDGRRRDGGGSGGRGDGRTDGRTILCDSRHRRSDTKRERAIERTNACVTRAPRRRPLRRRRRTSPRPCVGARARGARVAPRASRRSARPRSSWDRAARNE